MWDGWPLLEEFLLSALLINTTIEQFSIFAFQVIHVEPKRKQGWSASVSREDYDLQRMGSRGAAECSIASHPNGCLISISILPWTPRLIVANPLLPVVSCTNPGRLVSTLSVQDVLTGYRLLSGRQAARESYPARCKLCRLFLRSRLQRRNSPVPAIRRKAAPPMRSAFIATAPYLPVEAS